MDQQQAYLNGSLIAARALSVSATDPGFVMGVTVSEQIRTFHHKLFRADDHFARLNGSLQLIGITTVNLDDLRATADQLVARNSRDLNADDDLGLTIFVTPGESADQPTVGMFTRPLPFRNWKDKYSQGDHLVITSVRQVPSSCWPAELKCRSRMHYYLADQEAKRTRPDARAILLDQDGFVAEASTASLLIYRQDEGLIGPPRNKVLPGISVLMLKDLADKLKVPFVHREIRPEELFTADEVLLSSTSPCVWPVATIDNQQLTAGAVDTSISDQLLHAWSELVGVDIVQQAQQFADR